MRALFSSALFIGSCLFASGAALAAPQQVTVLKDDGGWRLQVDGQDTFLFGMNWGYMPIGENYSYDFWGHSDDFVEAQLRKEMSLLTGMGINTIRQYDDIPPRWVEWIYENYGIYTLINPLVGRYGAEIDGVWRPETNYADPRTREVLIERTLTSVARYTETRGVIGFMLGNEANYGLSWDSFEIQALPKDEQNAAKARSLYSLYGEIIDKIHAIDPNHPVSICNGDAQYIDIIAEEAGNMDIFGTNVYRGRTARDLYAVVEEKLDKPIFYSEFGADAYDAKSGREDGFTQATYFRDQWEDVYLHAHGNGGVGNAIGGYSFQWSDGWWKFRQEENLDVHDTNASWPNRAYIEDFVDGSNNMNEEWFGITAKTPPQPDGSFDVQPRPAYFLLRDAYRMHPYSATREEIVAHFDTLQPGNYAAEVAAFKALGAVQDRRVELTTARIDLSMYSTAGTYKPGGGAINAVVEGEQSVYLGGTVRPTDSMRAEAIINVVGDVADNPIDNIRYENRGNRNLTPDGFDGSLDGLDRVQIYQMSFDWATDQVDVEGFYRTGHYHWGFEGDLWGLYPEANYGPNLDTYFGIAPVGVEMTGKKSLDGLALAVGPQLWWGANPAAVARATRELLGVEWTLVHHEDLASANVSATSAAISEQVIRRTGLSAVYKQREWVVEASGLFSGSNKVGQDFTYTIDAEGGESYQDSGVHLVEDVIRWQDTLGGKVSISRPIARHRLFLQGGYQGLVADGGYDTRRNQLGWTLHPSGRGNQWHVNAGAFIPVGSSIQIGPNVLVNRPLVGPNDPMADAVDGANSWYYPGVSARNFRDDPFAVLDNRETYGGELLLVYDPTPGSYFFSWDNLERENAPFAASLDLAYRHQPTARDALFSFTSDGTLFAFPGSPPASDVWQVTSRMMFNASGTRVVLSPYVAQEQARGLDTRLITRSGIDLMAARGNLLVQGFARFNDWGPYDFYRDFNFTFPYQTMLDVSTGVGRARFLTASTRIGVRAKVRGFDENSVVTNPLDNIPASTIDAATGDAFMNIEPGAWEGELFTYLRVMR
ncbi:MAG: beta-galactosidase [Myxococcota bacterium]|jgi:beta-galactosidase